MYLSPSTDSVHNDGERHIPYITIFPNSTINKLYAWAKFQLSNGMIQEQLRCGCQSLPLEPQVSLSVSGDHTAVIVCIPSQGKRMLFCYSTFHQSVLLETCLYCYDWSSTHNTYRRLGNFRL